MKTLSIRIPNSLHLKLSGLARRRNSSKTEITREALEAYLQAGEESASLYDLASDLLGSCEGPADLSTNSKYLEGYGK